MATELSRDEYGVIRHLPEDEILELEWLEASADMTDDDFMGSMERFAKLAGEQSAPYLLVDVTKFGHSMGEGVGAWRDEHIVSRTTPRGYGSSRFSSRRALPALWRRETHRRRSHPASFRPATSRSAEASSPGSASDVESGGV